MLKLAELMAKLPDVETGKLVLDEILIELVIKGLPDDTMLAPLVSTALSLCTVETEERFVTEKDC